MTELFQDYIRKPFVIGAVQISPMNIKEVAEACGGEIRSDGKKEGHFSRDYIKVPVKQTINERQSQGYIGDWIVKQGRTFKVYPDKQFQASFELRANGTVVEKPQPSKQGRPKNQKRKGKGAQGSGRPTPSQMPKKRVDAPKGTPVSSNERKPLPKASHQGVEWDISANRPMAETLRLEQELVDQKIEEGKLPLEEPVRQLTPEDMPSHEHTFVAANPETVPEDRKAITLDELNSMPGDPRTADDIHREAWVEQTPGEKFRGEA